MKRQLILVCGCIFLLTGWMSAFLHRTVPQSQDFYYLLPTLLLAVGIGIILKIVSRRMTVFIVAITAVASIMAMNTLYPGQGVTLAGFRNKIKTVKGWKTITLQVREADRIGPFADERNFEAFADIEINLFAITPGPPRMLAFDQQGHLFVSIPKLDAIYRLHDKDQDGYVDQAKLFYADGDRPHGLVWDNNRLYVAETARLLELQDSDHDGRADQSRIILDDLPDDGGHSSRSLAKGRDETLFLSIGSRCNACDESDERRATVMQVDPATGKTAVFARGLRNSVGLAFSADGETLWGSDNGRDRLGDDLPPDEINRIVADGNYGWPHCYGKQLPDPELGNADLCKDTLASAFDLQAHSAPLGIAFGDQLAAPATFRNSLYVALHGSWNRSVPTGYKLVRIPFADGQPVGQGKEFLAGWLVDGQAWGRPVAPVVGPDGALYLTDDRTNAIYRIRWKSQE